MEFELARASTGVTATLWGIAGLLVALAAMFGWFAWSATHASVSIKDRVLAIDVPLYGRSISFSDLDLARAAIVDLDTDTALRPSVRTNGIGLPGYGVGWFRLRNGTKALLAVTTRNDILHIPTRDGYDLLLSVKQPARVLEQLRAKAAG